MATIVNNPSTTSDNSGTNGLLIGLVLILILGIVFWIFGMPYLRGNGGTPTVIENNVQAPEAQNQTPAEGETTINVPVPDQIDVNVQNGQSSQ